MAKDFSNVRKDLKDLYEFAVSSLTPVIFICFVISLLLLLQWGMRSLVLIETEFEQAPLVSDPAAIVLSKDAGLFTAGYKLVVKANQGKAQEVYVFVEDYASINAGDKICVQYKVIKGEMQGTSLCPTPTGEK